MHFERSTRGTSKPTTMQACIVYSAPYRDWNASVHQISCRIPNTVRSLSLSSSPCSSLAFIEQPLLLEIEFLFATISYVRIRLLLLFRFYFNFLWCVCVCLCIDYVCFKHHNFSVFISLSLSILLLMFFVCIVVVFFFCSGFISLDFEQFFGFICSIQINFSRCCDDCVCVFILSPFFVLRSSENANEMKCNTIQKKKHNFNAVVEFALWNAIPVVLVSFVLILAWSRFSDYFQHFSHCFRTAVAIGNACWCLDFSLKLNENDEKRRRITKK